MAAKTNQQLTKIVEGLIRNVDEQAIELSELRELVEELKENGVTVTRKGGREWTDEQRKVAGERLQMGRAKNLGLDSIEQLRALKLRPGQKPTKAEIKAVKKEFPVDAEVTEIDEDDAPDGAFGYSEEDLEAMKVAELRELADEYEVELPARSKKADIVELLLEL